MTQPAEATPSLAPASIRDAYRDKLRHVWQEDPAQAAAVSLLDTLALALQRPSAKPPKGLYLHGPVGRGKSQLLAMFMAGLGDVPARRIHMHSFMPELHRRLVEIKRGDPVEQMAAELSAECRVLGFDEFFVTNLGDGILLGRLFGFLFQRGVTVVATSNWPLEELFLGGRNRQRMLPYIRVLQDNLRVVDLGNGRDYRQRSESAWPLYLLTSDDRPATSQLQALFDHYCVGEAATPPEGMPATRFRTDGGWYQFDDICGRALGRIEYLHLVLRIETLVIEDVPRFSANDSDLVLRLVTLIDICYEHHRRVIVSAADFPDALYPDGPVATAFRRAASRLTEMQTWA